MLCHPFGVVYFRNLFYGEVGDRRVVRIEETEAEIAHARTIDDVAFYLIVAFLEMDEG